MAQQTGLGCWETATGHGGRGRAAWAARTLLCGGTARLEALSAESMHDKAGHEAGMRANAMATEFQLATV